jgi:tRNA uracil 4-sulfurtransferase
MKLLCLLSGGIDSPVAAYLMGRNGADIALLHMDNRPYSDNSAIEKVQQLTCVVEKRLGRAIELYVAPHGYNQLMIHQHTKQNMQCVLCKRTMLKVARNVARTIGAEAVVTGESLGQVASQTLHNLGAEEWDLGFPVLRPLIGIDKIEIEAMAKELGTYEISIQKGRACTIVPSRPAIMATPELVREQEKRLDIEARARESAEEAFSLRTGNSCGT